MSESSRARLLTLAESAMTDTPIDELGLRQIISENNIARIYSASYNPCYEYPYRLQKVQRAKPLISNRACEYILDSGFKDNSVTNNAILDKAAELRPNLIIPKDYPEDKPAKTAKSVAEFLELYENRSDVRANILAPLQPPYLETYRNHKHVYDQFSRIAVGGLHCFRKTSGQIQSIKKLRNELKRDVHIHALGVGTNVEFVYALRQNPTLIDSLDISTPEVAPMNNGLPDKTWIQHEFALPKGENRSLLQGHLAKYILLQLNYMLTDLFDDDEWESIANTSTSQSNIGTFTNQEEFSRTNPPREAHRSASHS